MRCPECRKEIVRAGHFWVCGHHRTPLTLPVHPSEQRLQAVLAGLPPKKLAQVVDFAAYLKSREEWEDTQELMNDPAMRKDVEEGRAQAARGKGRRWREIQRRVRG